MENIIDEVICDISKVCEDAKLNEDPKNLIHVLIAYLRTNKIKSEEDYAINAIVSVLIYELLSKLKVETVNVSINELAIFCKALMIYDESHEEKLEEKLDEKETIEV